MSNAQVHFYQFVDQVQDAFDGIVDAGSDQQLFVSGYLSGHFSLAVAECEKAQTLVADALQQHMQASLDAAFDKGELVSTDAQEVQALWDTLFADYPNAA